MGRGAYWNAYRHERTPVAIEGRGGARAGRGGSGRAGETTPAAAAPSGTSPTPPAFTGGGGDVSVFADAARCMRADAGTAPVVAAATATAAAGGEGGGDSGWASTPPPARQHSGMH